MERSARTASRPAYAISSNKPPNPIMRSRRVLRKSSAEGELISGSRIAFYILMVAPAGARLYNRLVYRALALILIPMSLGATELTVDHVTAAGRDLKAMRASLDAIGLASEYGG